jgi:hypothetical protein
MQSWRLLAVLLLLPLFSGIWPVPSVVSAANESVTLNPDGGNTDSDGLRVTVGFGAYQVYRNGLQNLYYSNTDGGAVAWMLTIEESGEVYCIVIGACNAENTIRPTNTTTQISDTLARSVLTAVTPGDQTFVLTIDSRYLPNRATVDMTVSVTAPAGYNGPLDLYFAGDVIFNNEDNGPTLITEFQGKPLLAQQVVSGAYGGVRESGTPFSSYFGGYWDCAYGMPSDAVPTHYCESVFAMEGGARGPSFGEPFPDFVLNGAEYDSVVSSWMRDAGIGVHWDLRELDTATVTSQLFFASNDQFEEQRDLPDPDAPTPTPQPTTAPTAVPQCDLTPDLAVSPAEIRLVPGGRATIELAMRNLCPSAVYSGADLLLSLADGLSVVGSGAQRFAVQNLSLSGGETRRWTIEVSWDQLITATPLHVTELYRGGRVVSRIDGVFLVPPDVTADSAAADSAAADSAAADSAAADSAAADSAAADSAAPLPTALPNTSGVPLPWSSIVLLTLSLLALSIGRMLVGARR